MQKTYLKRSHNYSKDFFKIKKELENWDFESVFGKSVIQRYDGSNYAHIEMKIHKNNEDNNCFIDWKITNEQIPIEIGYKEVVEKVLLFFIEYFSAIRGENYGLTFEIYNGSFKSISDTKNKDFNKATIEAIINCFNKDNEDFSKEIFPKISGNKYLKSHISKFYLNDIEKSLKDEKKIAEISKILKSKNESLFNNLLNLKNRDELSELITSDINRQKVYELSELKILNKYGDLTLEGFAHILNYYDKFDFKKIIE